MTPAALPVLWQAPGLRALPGVDHGFSGRHGGTSLPPYASLNVAQHLTDVAEHVRANRAGLLAALGRPAGSWRDATQVHGNAVARITADSPRTPPADALVTTDPAVTLAVQVADCVPVLLADGGAQVVGTAHAGWRGTVADVVRLAIAACCQAAGLAPAALHVALGPAIGPCCFAVGEPAASALVAFAALVGGQDACVLQGGRLHVDLWRLNAAAALASGVPATQVEVHRQCTACTTALFSYRRDAGTTGRQAGLIGLRRAAPRR